MNEDDLFGEEILPTDDGYGEDQGQSDFTQPDENLPEQMESQDTPASGEQIPNKQKPDRFEYWQSQATKYQAELKKFQQEAERLQAYAPVVRLFEENPQIIDKLEEVIRTPQGVADNKPQIEKPSKPAKPANYSPSEAYADPESESGKYLRALSDYQEGLIDYQEKVDALRQQQAEEIRLKAEREATTRNRMGEMYNELVTVHKMTPQRANDFIKKMSSRESWNLENLVRLYEIQNPEQDIKQQTKADQMRGRQGRQYPVPPSVGSTEEEKQYTDEELFNASLGKQNKTIRW